VAAFRAAVTERQPAAELAGQAEQEISDLIAALRGVLDNVRDLAEFHEALRDLKQLSEEQQRLMEETKRLLKNRLLDDLLK
jgi:cell shape-determining protein MreC